VLELLRAAGPLASVNVVVGIIGALLALTTIGLLLKGSSAARITAAFSSLAALVIAGLGFVGHGLAMVSIEAALSNVPADQKLMLLHQGTVEARANFSVALACLAIPLVAGLFGAAMSRFVPGLFLGVVAAAAAAMILVAYLGPVPSAEPQLAIAPRLELPESKSSRTLSVSVRLALATDGAWLDGVRAESLVQALDQLAALEPAMTTLPVLVDRRVTFGPFVQLVEAAGARGWHAVDLVVQGTGGSRNTVRVLDAPVDPGANPMLLTLFISPQALEVGSGNARLPPLPRDWSALSEQLVQIKAAFPDHRFLRIGASPEVSVADLVAALDVSRKKDERWLFDELVVGAFELPVVRPELPPVGTRVEP
jgi:biopolymer transport protein ExbD